MIERTRGRLYFLPLLLLAIWTCDEPAGVGNGAPRVADLEVSTPKNTILEVRVVATDPDGDALTFERVSGPEHGQLDGPIPDGAGIVLFRYTPNQGFAGLDEVVVEVSDGEDSARGRITIEVVNRVPTAAPAQVETGKGIVVVVELVAADEDDEDLEFEVVADPEHGTLGPIEAVDPVVGAGERRARVEYRPAAGFGGEDTFEFVARDPQASSTPGVVTITVRNAPPTAAPVAVETDTDTPVAIDLAGEDEDDAGLTYEVVQGPEHGTLGDIIRTGPKDSRVEYTPESGYSGQDGFSYRVVDGSAASSAAAQVTVTIRNGAPTAAEATASTTKNTPVVVTLSGSDPNGDAIVFEVVTAPATGALGTIAGATGATATVQYTPVDRFFGSETFTFRAVDAHGAVSEPALATVTVTNGAPTATAGSTAATDDATPVTVTLAGSDPDGDALLFGVVAAPSNGRLAPVTVTGPTTATVVYSPNGGFSGTDTFTFVVSDGFAVSSAVSVSITVNGRPTAAAQTLSVVKNTSIIVTLTGSDPEADPLTFAIAAGPFDGALGPITSTGPTSATVVYTPTPGFDGPDIFTYTANDGHSDSPPATVSITVPNRAPTVSPTAATTAPGTPVTVTLTGADPDGDALTFTTVSGPFHGALGPVTSTGATTATVQYTSHGEFAGDDTFTFTASDGSAVSAAGTASITVNGTPTTADQALSVDEDRTLAITLTGTDLDGDDLTFAIASGPTNGTLGAVDNSATSTAAVTYTPTAGGPNTDAIGFTVSDGTSPLATGTVTISIRDVPVATSFDALGNTQLVTTGFGSPPSTPTVTVTGGVLASTPSLSIQNPGTPIVTIAGGSVTLEPDGDFLYTPHVGAESLTDQFTFITTSGRTATVSIDLGQPVWYIRDTASGNGSSASPFATLGEAATASGTGDILFVHAGTSGTTPLAGGITLQDGQSLIGEAAGLTVTVGGSPLTLVTAGARPALTNAAGVGVTLADGNVVDGFEIRGTSGAGLSGTLVAGGTIRDVDVGSPGGDGLALDRTTGTWVIDDLRVDGSTGTAVVLLGTAGSYTFADFHSADAGDDGVRIDGGSPTVSLHLAASSISGADGNPLQVTGTSGGSVTLTGGPISDTDGGPGLVFSDVGGAVSISNAVTLTGSTGAPIFATAGTANITFTGAVGITATGVTGVSADSRTGTLSFSSLNLNITNGTALEATNAGAVAIGAGSIAATGAPAIDATGTTLTGSLTSTSSSGSATTGLFLDNIGSGTLSLGSGAITGAAGKAVDINGGSATLSYSGSITNTAGNAVEITGLIGGAITLSGSITHDNGAGGAINSTGLLVSGNTGGVITFSGGTKRFNTGTATAVDLTGNTGASVSFTGGGLDIDATTGVGLNATAGGMISVAGPNNTILTTTGAALTVQNTSIGASDLVFRSITAGTAGGGPTSAIVLASTGTTGGLTVTGDGGGTPNGSGGTIQRTTASAVVATSTADLNLASIRIENPAGSGILATDLSGSGNALSNSTITGFDAGGTNTEDALHIVNDNVNLGAFTITGSTFSSGASGNDAVFMEARGSSNMTLSVASSTFTNLFSDGIHVTGLTGSTGTMRLTVSNSTFTNAVPTVGNGGISLTPFGGMRFFADINGNSFTDMMRAVSNLGAISGTNGLTTVADITIRNNTMDDLEGSRGITFSADGSATTRLLIDNNSIDRLGSTSKHGVSVNIIEGTGDATITNNRIGQAANLWTAGDGTGNGILALTQNGALLDVLISGNSVRANTSSVIEVVRTRAIQSSTLNATVMNNTIDDISGTHTEFDASTGTSAVAGGTIRLNISGNILPAAGVGRIQLTENAAPGSILVTQASAAAVSTGNSAATVAVTGAPDFGQAAPTLPTAPTLPLFAASRHPQDPGRPAHRALAPDDLRTLGRAAVAWWETAELTEAQRAILQGVRFSMAPLEDGRLGHAAPGIVVVDDDGAGIGWSVDATPLFHEELYPRYDLLSVLLHELGHQLGLSDSYGEGAPGALMSGILRPGERRVPAQLATTPQR